MLPPPSRDAPRPSALPALRAFVNSTDLLFSACAAPSRASHAENTGCEVNLIRVPLGSGLLMEQGTKGPWIRCTHDKDQIWCF